jgi:hypothetical protein
VSTFTQLDSYSKLTNTVAKFAVLLDYFEKRLREINIGPHTVEGCEFALALIDRATDLDWERIGRDAKLKDRPRTTIGLLRAEFQRRLNAARAEESIR